MINIKVKGYDFRYKQWYIEFVNKRINLAIKYIIDFDDYIKDGNFYNSIDRKEEYINHEMQCLYFLEHKSLEELFELDMNDLGLIKQVNLSINEQIQLEDSVKEVVKKERKFL